MATHARSIPVNRSIGHGHGEANPRPAPTSRDGALTEISAARAEQLAEVLRALGHPLRLRIVALLCREELHVNALAERLGVAQVTMSQQLRILRLTRLVDVTRTAGQALYRLAQPELRVLFACLSHGPGEGEEER